MWSSSGVVKLWCGGQVMVWSSYGMVVKLWCGGPVMVWWSSYGLAECGQVMVWLSVVNLWCGGQVMV